MPIRLQGSCRCRAVSFTLESHTPYPYQLCYCTICRKTAGGGGYAINIMGENRTLKIDGAQVIGVYRAEIVDADCRCEVSKGRRSFCTRCGSALWLWDERWPTLVHPLASAIDTDLPVPPDRTHLMLRFKASWVVPAIAAQDQCFDLYPTESIEDWHKARGLWID